MNITIDIELKLIEYYLTPHTLRDTARVILGHKGTKAASAILAKHGIPKHSKEINRQLWEEANLIKYGVRNPSSSAEIKEKRKQSLQQKYGVDNIFQAKATKEQIKQTCLEKYGADHYNKTKEGQKKRKETCLARYGVDHYNKTAEGKTRREQTCISRYGVSAYTQTEEYKNKVRIKQKDSTAKQLATKRKNNTFACSTAEKKYFKVFQDLFGVTEVIPQYKEARYPFLCDFYIKSLDLFIELNFTWTHGGGLFTGCDKDLEKLILWQQKAQTSKYYQNAIETWTKRDPTKYKTAQDNCLNYLVFYTQNDLEIWLVEIANKLNTNTLPILKF